MIPLTKPKRIAVLAQLIGKLAEAGSWNGETHIQKTVYFLTTATGVPTGFDFTMYKHGPYSFDLHDELVWMKTNGFVRAEPHAPYGPSFRLGELGEALLGRFPKTVRRFTDEIEFVARELGGRQVVELERLATAWYVTVDSSEAGAEDRARSVNALKPHIAIEDARSAVQKVDDILTRAPG